MLQSARPVHETEAPSASASAQSDCARHVADAPAPSERWQSACPSQTAVEAGPSEPTHSPWVGHEKVTAAVPASMVQSESQVVVQAPSQVRAQVPRPEHEQLEGLQLQSVFGRQHAAPLHTAHAGLASASRTRTPNTPTDRPSTNDSCHAAFGSTTATKSRAHQRRHPREEPGGPQARDLCVHPRSGSEPAGRRFSSLAAVPPFPSGWSPPCKQSGPGSEWASGA